MSWDFFISHASEDKPLARDIAFALAKRGKSVWFDEFTLNAGDSLRRSIDYGLAHSRFGIVILSPFFLAKEWPNKELDALVARDDGSKKFIIPIWHLVNRQDVLQFSPTLADKLAIDSQLQTHEIVRQILSATDQECIDEPSLHLSVLIVGATGCGKSSLSRKLWHHPLMYRLDEGHITRSKALVQDKSGCAYWIEYYILSWGDKEDEEFMEAIARQVNAVDVVLGVFNVNSLLLRSEVGLLKEVAEFTRKPIIFAINCDSIAAESWDEQQNCPTSELQERIDMFIDSLNKKMGISKDAFVQTSAERNYGIERLRDVLLARRTI